MWLPAPNTNLTDMLRASYFCSAFADDLRQVRVAVTEYALLLLLW